MAETAPRIAAVPVLKGTIVYAATASFAVLYCYFMTQIVQATDGKPPDLDDATVGAAAALAGVLGSAFALAIGAPSDVAGTNTSLAAAMADDQRKDTARTKMRRMLSLEPPDPSQPSIPLSVGVWFYAAVGAAVSIVYFTNPAETPEAVKSLAVLFGGYVLTFLAAAYGVSTGGGTGE